MSVKYIPPEQFTTVHDEAEIRRAARAIAGAQGLIIMAGAGLGVASGIPTYRTNEDFWVAHPELKHTGCGIPEMSNSKLFRLDPELAWGFIANRLHLYRSRNPHKGYQILKNWAEAMEQGYFIFTSNVDRHFTRAGFSEDRVVERHGSLEYLQCVDVGICSQIWSTPVDFHIPWDPKTLRAQGTLPSVVLHDSTESCQHPPCHRNNIIIKPRTKLKEEGDLDECQRCLATKHLLRPNMRFFNDDQWINEHVLKKESKFHRFVSGTLAGQRKNFVVLEIGVGVTVDTVRPTTDKLVEQFQEFCTLVRINPIEPEVQNNKHISVRMTGLKALEEIDRYVKLC